MVGDDLNEVLLRDAAIEITLTNENADVLLEG